MGVIRLTTDVYGDILFLINAAMDCLCFLLTARLLRRRICGWRLALACLLGGAYAVAALFAEIVRVVALLLDVLFCVLLCGIVFLPEKDRGRRRWLTILPVTGVYLLVSFIMGGVMTGLYNLLNRAGCPEELTGAETDGPTAWLFALLALIGGVLSLWGGRMFRRIGCHQEATLTVELNGQSVTLTGMVDSGNLLTDPLDGRPVIPVQACAVACLFSPALRTVLQEGSIMTVPNDVPEASRLRLIPAATATGQGLLVGIRPDRITIQENDQQRVTETSALIAPLEIPGAAEAGSHAPQALIPATLI